MVNLANTSYKFPHVKFTESTLGPLPITPEWRNTIGVAGVFNKGPVGPTKISSRQQFYTLFGEDDAPGSIFVRQAMLQNATNFVISRVMPSAKTSSGLVSLQAATSPTINEAFVATGNARTVGLTFSASYIGSPVIEAGLYVGAPVLVDPNSQLGLENFVGTGFFDFQVNEKIVTANVANSAALTLTLKNAGVSGVQRLSLASTSPNINVFRSSAKPGMVISLAAGDTSGLTLATSGLEVLSYPYQSSTGVWSVLVSGSVTGAASDGTSASVIFKAPTTGNYFILSYSFRTPDGAALPATTIPQQQYDTAGTVLGFFTVGELEKSYQPINLFNEEAGVITLNNTGIDLSLGDTNSVVATELIPMAKFSIPVMQGRVSIGETNGSAVGFPNTTKSFVGGTSAVEILQQLRDTINRDEVLTGIFGDVELNDSNVPYSLRFITNFEGAEANRVFYTLTRTYGSEGDSSSLSGSGETVEGALNASNTVSGTPPLDILFGANGALYNTPQQMTGGRDGMRPSSLFLYDLAGNPLAYIEALSPGKAGNKIKISVRPLPPGRFRIDVSDESDDTNAVIKPTSESYLLSNYTVDAQTGIYPETLDSKLIRAYFVPVAKGGSTPVNKSTYDLTPQRVAPPLAALASSIIIANPLHPSHRGVSYLKELFLKEGSEPIDYSTTQVPEDDYVEAIRRLESEDCSIIAAAGITVSDIRYEQVVSELLVQAEQSSTFNGLRVAVIAAPPKLTAARSESITAGLSSDRLVVVAGYCTLSGARYLGLNSLPPDGFYAGVLAATPPHVSPASIYAGRPASGVLSTDSKNDPAYLDAITQSRIEMLHFDNGMQLYKFLNGVTTSSEFNTRWVSVRRQADQIIMDLYSNLQWVRSAPHNRELRSKVASAVDAYLRGLMRDQRIMSYQPTVCDESNNSSSDIAQGRLNVTLTYTPVYPADYINVDLVRDISSEFSLTVTAG